MIGNNSKGPPHRQAGQSLIELVVAIGLFGTAVTIGLGLILILTRAQTKAANIRATLDGIGFSMEIMTKEIRTGYSYSAPYFGANEFSFTNSVDDIITYRSESNRLERACTGTCGGGGGTGFLPVTSSDISVHRLAFYLHGEAILPDKEQPWVIIVMGVKAGDKDTAQINLETTVTQRRIDN